MEKNDNKLMGFQPDLMTKHKIGEAMEVLGITNRSEVIRYALQEGLNIIIDRHKKKGK